MSSSHSAPLPLHHVSAGAGHPVVLLHPIAMRTEFWDAVAARLSRACQVVSLDLRGHGQNPPAEAPFSIDDLAGDVVALARSCRSVPRHSLAARWAAWSPRASRCRRPDLVTGLVLANTTHTMGEKGADVMQKRAEESAKGLDRTVEPDISRWLSEAFRTAHPDTVETVRGWVLENDAADGLGWQAISRLDTNPGLPAFRSRCW